MAEPKPFEPELPFEQFYFHHRVGQKLIIPKSWPDKTAMHTLENRATYRAFGSLDDELLGALLWFAARTKETRTLPSGFTWQHRAAPSAGGRHPVHILVITPQIGVQEVKLYDAVAHAFSVLDDIPSSSGDEILHLARQIVPTEDATLLWLVAEPARTLTRYQFWESLVWRDAGMLLATLAFASEALGLAHCCLGATGEEWVQSTFNSEKLLGVGGFWVGSRIAS